MGLADERKPVNLMTVHVSKSVTVHEVSNTLYQKLDDCTMNQTIYNRIIDQLINLECIEVINEKIWLREWISQKYVN